MRRVRRVQSPEGLPPASLLTWESEVRAIAQEAAGWTVETGGDLFGVWHQTPTIYLATRVGPGAVRDRAHFRLDLDYLRRLSEVLAADWGLRYFGDWHSHHRLGLSDPSRGDRQRIRRVAARNSFPGMAEIVVTFADSGKAVSSAVRLHPWIYDDGVPDPVVSDLVILTGGGPRRSREVDRLRLTGVTQVRDGLERVDQELDQERDEVIQRYSREVDQWRAAG